MNKIIAVLVIGIVMGMTALAFAGVKSPYAGATAQQSTFQAQPCLMYGMMTDGTLYPVQVTANGTISTTN